MKKFTKGNLVSIVEDDDRRIADYLKGGWKEETLTARPLSLEDELLSKAIDDANDSEPKKAGKKNTSPDKKVNDAIKANTSAKAEAEAVDDGLLSKGGN